MRVANSAIRISLTLGAAALACGAHADDRAIRELLFRSMKQALNLNVIAIVEQRGESDDLFRKIKLEQCSSGKLARTVLQPLSMEGVQIWDDGERTFTLLPDERVLIEQASNRGLLENAAMRAALTERNYALSLGRTQSIAGRTAIAVIARPKIPGMPTRQIFLDEETLYPLRVVTVGPEGDKRVRIDTKAIYYPEEAPQQTFTFQADRVRKIRYGKPERVETGLRHYTGKLGFAGQLPRSLPLGFVVQEAEVLDTPDCRTLVVRLTDGLARATIYQTRGRQDQPVWHFGPKTTVTANGVTYVLVSDLPSEARVKLLGSFVKLTPALLRPTWQAAPAIASPHAPYREPAKLPQALTDEEKPVESPAKQEPQPLHAEGSEAEELE